MCRTEAGKNLAESASVVNTSARNGIMKSRLGADIAKPDPGLGETRFGYYCKEIVNMSPPPPQWSIRTTE